MIDVRLLKEAERNLTVCNACRYCEGLCPVFVSLERRRTFVEGDVIYLANLCHDCGSCFDVCPFSPPHELNINIPRILAEVRVETYRGYAAPQILSRAFSHGSRTAAVATLGAMAAILAFAVIFSPGQLFQAIAGPGSFYQVIPWAAMVIAAVALSLYGIGIMALGVFRFWRDTEGPLASKLDGPSFVSATLDVLGLRQMRGGGAGCTYPDGRPSHRRLVSHELVFFGFVLTFLSTVMAAAAQDLLDVLPPYPLWSPIVVAGTIGGLMQIAGCSGLIALKLRASEIPASTTMRQLDFAFLELLLALNVTGLALLVLRDSPAMGSLLVVHLGTVAGLFITMPYGKFVHGLYRYASLVRNRREELQEVAATSNRRSDPDILAGV